MFAESPPPFLPPPHAPSVFSIPVLPQQENGENSTNHPKNSALKNFETSLESVQDPAQKSPNEQTVSGLTTAGAVTFSDILKDIPSAQVTTYGGLGGSTSVRLRGARAFEPSYFFHGFPLAGAATGEQNADLIPISHTGSLQVYPDTAPFWLGSPGIGGDVDIQPCRREDCFITGKNQDPWRWQARGGVGSFGERFGSASGSWKQSASSLGSQPVHEAEVYADVFYLTSQEDYPVYVNRSLLGAPGTYEDLQNNDIEKVGAGLGGETLSPVFGVVNADLVWGQANQGIPAAPGDPPSQVRLSRDLVVGTVRSEKLFAANGVRWWNQLGGSLNTLSLTEPLDVLSVQSEDSQSYVLQAKSWVVIPTELWHKEQTGFSLDISYSHNQNDATALGQNSSVNPYKSSADRWESRLGIFQGVTLPLSENLGELSLGASGWVSVAQTQASLDCTTPTGQIYCASPEQLQDMDTPLVGATVSVQADLWQMFVPYTRFTYSERRPYLAEVYGSPGGVVANPDLKPEKSNKWELGVRIPWGEGGIFYGQDKNLILLEPLSSLTAQYQNLAQGTRRGLFLNGAVDFLQYLEFSGAYQYLESKTNEGPQGSSVFVPRSPKHQGTLQLEGRQIPLNTPKKMLVGAYGNVQMQSSFYLDTANINQMEVPPVYNAGAHVQFRFYAQMMKVALDAENITNELFSDVYNDLGGVWSINSNGYFGVPLPGRRLKLSLWVEI